MTTRILAAVNDAALTSGSDSKRSVVGVQVTGTFVGTILIEGTVDGGTWVTLAIDPFGGGAAVTSITAPGAWKVDVSGLALVRARMSAWTSGAATVALLPVVNS